MQCWLQVRQLQEENALFFLHLFILLGCLGGFLHSRQSYRDNKELHAQFNSPFPNVCDTWAVSLASFGTALISPWPFMPTLKQDRLFHFSFSFIFFFLLPIKLSSSEAVSDLIPGPQGGLGWARWGKAQLKKEVPTWAGLHTICLRTICRTCLQWILKIQQRKQSWLLKIRLLLRCVCRQGSPATHGHY